MTKVPSAKLLLLASASALSFALNLSPASATGLPIAKLNALQCTSSPSQSCCERWVNLVVGAAKVETDAGSFLSALPRRIDRWVIIEKRPYCDIKKDIEARARAVGEKRLQP